MIILSSYYYVFGWSNKILFKPNIGAAFSVVWQTEEEEMK